MGGSHIDRPYKYLLTINVALDAQTPLPLHVAMPQPRRVANVTVCDVTGVQLMFVWCGKNDFPIAKKVESSY